MIDISELRRLLTAWKAELDGCPEIRAYGELVGAAIDALPELLDEIERLARQNTDLQRRNTELVERNRQLEAAVTQLAALAPCDCDSRLPIRTHEAISNCPHLKAADIVKALKEKAEGPPLHK